ncbi:DUF4442 domain-containing protein [Aliikangiella marina]|uniref:DUF4442 domain-containing protein n=1 Tax=Aliikangiella marina TaxID=1712262 RepID=A0A545TJ62_9GAMM|nr:hotdog fold domain-containing protein [Aliikangiella marina]TQV77248.1 DUF4442 domain-containing protein [Aliikangiella marina]
MNKTLKIYNQLKNYPLGKKLFSIIVCRTAPYFGTIKPLITHLEANHCECQISKRKRVHNHINTVHVIAICNGLEMAMGVMAEATVPKHLRWIPKGMSVEYTAKAGTDIRCVAKMQPEDWQPGEQEVVVKAYDINNVVVVEGIIRLWISEKKKC